MQKPSNSSKKKPPSNQISSPEESLNTTGTPTDQAGTTDAINIVAPTVTTTTTVAAEAIEFVHDQQRRVDMEKAVPFPKNDGDDLDQVFGNISVDPIIGEIDEWDDIFPCFRELEGDAMGLFMSTGPFGEE